MVGFEHGEVFLPQVGVPRLTGVQREEKRQVRVVGIQQIEVAKIECVVSGNGRQKRVQQVVALFIELRVMDTENLIELGCGPVDTGQIAVVNNDGQGELPEIVSVKLNFLDSLPKLANL